MTAMTFDFVVAGRRDLEPTSIVLAVDEASNGEQLSLQPDRDQRVLAVLDADDTVRCWIGPTRQVADAEHAASRFGLGSLTRSATYWTEIVVPENCDLELADRICTAMAGHCDGHIVRLFDPADQPVELPPAAVGIDRGPFDVTGRDAVMVVRRSVVTLGPWLTHSLLYAANDRRRLVLLTPPETSLSPVVERLVLHDDVRWLVDDGQIAVEPHRGRPMAWDGEAFAETQEEKPSGWREPGDSAWVFALDAEVLHPYDRATPGTMTESVVAAFDRGKPQFAGLMEPPESEWDVAAVTELARVMSQGSTSLCVEGQGWHGSLTIQPEPGGVMERCELLLDAGAEPMDADGLFALGQRVADTGVQFAMIGYRWATERHVITPASVNPALPAALVADPARFPGLTSRTLRAHVGDHLREHGRHWVMAFESPHDTTREQSRQLMQRWGSALELLRTHDEIALAVARQRDN